MFVIYYFAIMMRKKWTKVTYYKVKKNTQLTFGKAQFIIDLQVSSLLSNHDQIFQKVLPRT